MESQRDLFDNGHTGSGFLVGLVTGTLVGAGLGLLLAPRAGSETRRHLGASAGRLQRNAADSYNRASSVVNDLVQRGQSAVEKGRDAFDRARETAQRTGESLQAAIDEEIPQ